MGILFRVITIIMLLLCLGGMHLEYEYYTILRFVVCGTAIYTAYFSDKLNKKSWAWILV